MASATVRHVWQALTRTFSMLSVELHRSRHRTLCRCRWSDDRTFQERLDAIRAKNPRHERAVDIGFPLPVTSQSEAEDKARIQHSKWRKSRGNLEYAARHRKLKLDLGSLQEKWQQEQGPFHIRNITEHYGVFTDLYGAVFFHTTTPLSICYDYDDTFVTPVYYGNRIPPSEAALPPFVDYKSDDKTLWTLVMTSPDGDLQGNDKECLHWMVGNIPGCEITGGETICNYLQPFPVRGAGYLRYVFVLYRQNKRLDFSSHQRPASCRSLSERAFSTARFHRQYRAHITPASVCFFQSCWDTSVTSVFHGILEMKEPCYEFVPPPAYPSEENTSILQQPLDSIFNFLEEDIEFPEDLLLYGRSHPTETQTEDDTSKRLNTSTVPMKARLKTLRQVKHKWKELTPET